MSYHIPIDKFLIIFFYIDACFLLSYFGTNLAESLVTSRLYTSQGIYEVCYNDVQCSSCNKPFVADGFDESVIQAKNGEFLVKNCSMGI